jgi:hypothetical protein
LGERIGKRETTEETKGAEKRRGNAVIYVCTNEPPDLYKEMKRGVAHASTVHASCFLPYQILGTNSSTAMKQARG